MAYSRSENTIFSPRTRNQAISTTLKFLTEDGIRRISLSKNLLLFYFLSNWTEFLLHLCTVLLFDTGSVTTDVSFM